MKKSLKKFLIVGVIFTIMTAATGLSTPVFADEPSDDSGEATTEIRCEHFLGMPSWDCNINKNPANDDELQQNILGIASNIFIAISICASYIILGFVIYGGYLYMISSGDINKVAAGRRTLTNAFIGLAITLLASVIISTIRLALIGDTSLAACNTTNGCGDVNDNTLFVNFINWILGFTGIVAVIFIIISGISYVTSSGDVNRIQKAKKTLTYAIIGLVIVGLARIITAFVSSNIRNSAKTSYTNEIIIAKEVANEK